MEDTQIIQAFFARNERAIDAVQNAYGETTVLEFSGNCRYKDTEGNIIVHTSNRITGFHTKFLFWSDGLYLYCLKIPIAYPLTITRVEEIVTSLSAVEDIAAYLPDSE